jgi:hypothetical protein
MSAYQARMLRLPYIQENIRKRGGKSTTKGGAAAKATENIRKERDAIPIK